MVAVYDMLRRFLGNWSYANLWFAPVKSQADLTGWINYSVKPWPIANWYRRALFSGCDLINLNYLFDDIALQSCSGLFPLVYSPRLAGVLHPNSKARYILDRVPRCLTIKEVAQCQNELVDKHSK